MNDEIEQQLRDGFPFAAQWLYRCTERHCYYLQGDGDNSIALHRHQHPESWGAKLEGSPGWTLAANEGTTPAEAIANLQQAIAQVAALAEDSLTRTALEAFRQYMEASLD